MHLKVDWALIHGFSLRNPNPTLTLSLKNCHFVQKSALVEKE